MSKYTITEVFTELPYLNVSEVAKLSGINRSLLSHYMSGLKKPSFKQRQKIEQALRNIGNDLLNITITN